MDVKTQLNRKTKKWPQDWDMHILNTCEFYFEKDISFCTGVAFFTYSVENVKNTEVRLIFQIHSKGYKGKHNYGASLKYIEKDIIKLDVYYLVKNLISIDEISASIRICDGSEIEQAEHSMLLVFPVKSKLIKNPYACAKAIEKIILEDVPQREDGEDDDDNSDEVPTEPFNSDPVFQLDPIKPIYA
tara:strand:- start:5079 stop:5639 length:561 start_codon:yes stop_codon:yes gene_type:complete